MENTFLTQTECDRCKSHLRIRTMSWFTTDTICGTCHDLENEIRIHLPNGGREHEGCGFVPNVLPGLTRIK